MLSIVAIILQVLIMAGILILWWWLRKKLKTPTPSPIPVAGIITVPVSGLTSLPPTSSVRITPSPIPTPVNSTGITVNITVLVGGSPVPNVPVEVRIAPGIDAGVTSLIDIGPDPVTGNNRVGSGLDSATGADPSNPGSLSFTLRATGNGDEDVMTITVGTWGRKYEESFSYDTVIP